MNTEVKDQKEQKQRVTKLVKRQSVYTLNRHERRKQEALARKNKK